MLVDVTQVPELNDIEQTQSGIIFGASNTLSSVERELIVAVEREPGTLIYKYIAVHFIVNAAYLSCLIFICR